MQRRRLILIASALALVGAIVLWFCNREQEPGYQGKKLGEWLDLYVSMSPEQHASEEGREVENAIRQIGPAALPCLLRWIHYETPAWQKKLRRAAPGLPKVISNNSMIQRLLANRYGPRAEVAIVGFEILGSKGSDVLPELTRLMNNQRAPDTAFCAMACSAFIGKSGLPPLREAFTNQANPLLFRFAAASYISEMGANAREAVPELIRSVEDQDPRIAAAAADALGWLAADPTVAAPVIAHALMTSDAQLRLAAGRALARYGVRARSVAPALLKMLDDPELKNRQDIANALHTVAPDIEPANHTISSQIKR